jgi:hypothetical protein
VHGICGVDCDDMFVEMILVRMVQMAIVKVVHMAVVPNRGVSIFIGGAFNSFGECRRNLALVPCRLPTRRFQIIRGFCSRDDRVYRCVQRLMGGWISRHHNGLRHADSLP